jgi:hypothetical protein
LPADVVVGGWLYRHTCFTAAKARRAEHRRQIREREAFLMNTLNDQEDATWKQVAPVLDEAMKQLGNRDRDAIVLRFFEQQSLRAVGQALGGSEDAARMRVDRALGKLRQFLTRRGIVLSGAALATVMGSDAITAAPTGLAVTVTSAALASEAAATGGIGLAILNAAAKSKLTIASAVAVVALAAPLLWQHRALHRLREDNAALRERARPFAQPRADSVWLAMSTADADEIERLRREHIELMRLRGQVGLLRQQLRHPAAGLPGTNEAATSAETQTNVAPAQVTITAKIAECPESTLEKLAGIYGNTTGPAVLTESQAASALSVLTTETGVDLLTGPSVTTLSGRQAQLSIQQPVELDGTNVMVGPAFDVIPTVQADGESIHIAAVFNLTQLPTNAAVGASTAQLVSTMEASGEAVIGEGQTLLLHKAAPRTGVDGGNSARKRLLVFLRAVQIDPAGNRVHTPDQSSAATQRGLSSK